MIQEFQRFQYASLLCTLKRHWETQCRVQTKLLFVFWEKGDQTYAQMVLKLTNRTNFSESRSSYLWIHTRSRIILSRHCRHVVWSSFPWNFFQKVLALFWTKEQDYVPHMFFCRGLQHCSERFTRAEWGKLYQKTKQTDLKVITKSRWWQHFVELPTSPDSLIISGSFWPKFTRKHV